VAREAVPFRSGGLRCFLYWPFPAFLHFRFILCNKAGRAGEGRGAGKAKGCRPPHTMSAEYRALREVAWRIPSTERRIQVLQILLDEAKDEQHAAGMGRLRRECLETATLELQEALAGLHAHTLHAYVTSICVDDEGLPEGVRRTTLTPVDLPPDQFQFKVVINEARGELEIEEDHTGYIRFDGCEVEVTEAVIRHTTLNDDGAQSYHSTQCLAFNDGWEGNESRASHMSWRDISVDLYLYRS